MPKHSITTVDIGQQYGRWVVLSLSSLGTNTSPKKYRCRCTCGTERAVPAIQLVRGKSISCGCFRIEQARNATATIASTYRAEYSCYQSMKDRCLNSRNPAYKYYGGRGIIICDRWIESFEHFFVDMGPRPSLTHTLDRFPDKNGNYEPDNCRWATKREQSNNSRRCRYIEFAGRTQTIAEWAREYCVPYSSIPMADRTRLAFTRCSY